jgi:magnesium transporter
MGAIANMDERRSSATPHGTDQGAGDPGAFLGTALSHVTRRIPIATPGDTAGEVRHRLPGQSFDSAADVAVVEGERLVGLVAIERLLAAADEVSVGDIMDDDPPVVAPHVDQEVVAWQMVRHQETSLCVVDEAGRFCGLVPPIRMLAVLLEEHEEDLARLSGVLHETSRARSATEEPVRWRLWHRLPWLLVGLVGAVFAASIVGAYEGQLADQVILAFFIPAVVYLADAVGTQTETVVIRGLSVGVPIKGILGREAITGVVTGLVMAAVFLPVAMLIWGEPRIIAAVGLALLAACSVATIVAMLLPAALTRLNLDPAFGAGPLATVIQDLLSILIYFVIVTGLAL